MDASVLQTITVVPRLLVLAGIVTALAFAIARRRTLGRAGPLAIAGLSMLVVNALFDIVGVMIIYYGYFHHRLLPMGDYVAIQALISAVSALLWVAGMVLVVVAVFVGRKAVTPDPDRTFPPAGPLP